MCVGTSATAPELWSWKHSAVQPGPANDEQPQQQGEDRGRVRAAGVRHTHSSYPYTTSVQLYSNGCCRMASSKDAGLKFVKIWELGETGLVEFQK